MDMELQDPGWADRVAERRKGKPPWVYTPFGDFHKYLEQTWQLLQVLVEGAHRLRGMPQLSEALLQLQTDEEDRKEYQNRLEQSRKLAESASVQFESGFPLLHGHLLVGTWGAVEATILDVLSAWLTNMPEALVGGDKRRIRLSMRRLLSLSHQERVQLAVRHLSEDGDSEYDRRGIGKFVHCLSAVGIDASAPKEIRDALYEVQQVRHVFAHRAGIADEPFVTSCPSFDAKVGEPVQVDHARFHRYEGQLLAYMVLLLDRSFDRYEALAGSNGNGGA